jgi:Response regulator receiver domain
MARVLIVQGQARSRADTAATLRAEGHDVLEAGSADNGVRLAHEEGPEVILLDPMLPDRSGYELYASLQRDPATLAIPVLFLPGELPPVPGAGDEPAIGGLDIVTRLGLALRTKSLNDELRLADVSLRSAVLTDSLTGLANRRAAEERLRTLTGLARVGMGPVSAPPSARRPHPHRLLRRRRAPPPRTPGATSSTAPKPPSPEPDEPAATAARSPSVARVRPCGGGTAPPRRPPRRSGWPGTRPAPSRGSSRRAGRGAGRAGSRSPG